jgi:hypothetical protein
MASTSNDSIIMPVKYVSVKENGTGHTAIRIGNDDHGC